MKISKRSKVEAGIIALIVCLACVASVMSTRTITDSSDSVYGQIIAGQNTFAATAAGLQQAIYSLNGTGGKVILPLCNITCSSTIFITSNISIIGSGMEKTIIYLNNNVNRSVMGNYNAGSSPFNINIIITDLTINHNGMNQPAVVTTGEAATAGRHKPTLNLTGTKNVLIERVNISNSIMDGLQCYRGRNITVNDCYFYKAGIHVKAHSLLAYGAAGLLFSQVNDSIVSHCRSYDCYSVGFLFETGVGTPENTWTRNIIVDSCIAQKSCNGFYLECAKDIILSDCIAYNCTTTTIYGGSYGFRATANTENVQFNGCQALRNGKYSGTITTDLPANFFVEGNNNSIFDCTSSESYGYGYYVGERAKMHGCRSMNDLNTSIYSVGFGVTISDCNIYNSGWTGIVIYSATGSASGIYIHINDCIIERTRNYGIATSVSNTTIDGCTIKNTTNQAIYISGANGNKYLKVSDSRLYTNTGLAWGIRAYTGGFLNCTFSDNTINGYATAGIDLRTGNNNTVSGNRILNCGTGITETAGANFNNIYFNDLSGCTAKLTITGTNTISLFNEGSYATVPLVNMTAYGVRAGFMWYSIADNKLYIYDGTAWDQVAFT